jgi:dolichyl-phosphate-mannose--protein O-mannosyl transferase
MVFLTEGSHIRLQHKTTEKRLHSHDVRPPISEVDFQNEVTGYGFEGFAGDALVLLHPPFPLFYPPEVPLHLSPS